jgi:two-component system OmpR family response regulator
VQTDVYRLPNLVDRPAVGSVDEPTRGGARLLVVDDEPNISALLSATLRLFAFEVRVVGRGHEVLAAARSSGPTS